MHYVGSVAGSKEGTPPFDTSREGKGAFTFVLGEGRVVPGWEFLGVK